MRIRPPRSAASVHVCFVLALFWLVGCQPGGATAVASTKADEGASTAGSADKAEVPAAPSAKAPASPNAAHSESLAAGTKPSPSKKAKASPPAKKAATAKPVAKDKKPNFSIKTTGASVKVGAKGAASVSIAALNGYKWNKDYPAKLIFKESPKTVQLGKSEFKQMSGDFKVAEKKASIPVRMKGNTSGNETIAGVVKFSICNETACIIEKADVKLAVNVTQ